MGLAVLVTLVLPHAAMSQRAAANQQKTVLFVCEHGTVKSVLAKVLFEQYAREAGLSMRAESRGTHADSVVPPWMINSLALDQIQLGTWQPRTLRPADLSNAAYIVSFDVSPDATAAAGAPREQWDGLPSVSQDYGKGRDAIKARIRHLVDSLKRAEQPRGRIRDR